jgi:hypothetical protein
MEYILKIFTGPENGNRDTNLISCPCIMIGKK